MAYGMLLSVFCMSLTIFAYLLVPELRNLRGKCLISYLIGLTVGYSTLSWHTLVSPMNARSINCKLMGYITYLFVVSSFLWLNLIAFNAWRDLGRTMPRVITKSNNSNGRFLKYASCVWGLAILLTLSTGAAEELLDIPKVYKPGFSVGESCWLDMRSWAAMIYFFGPILLITTINTVLFGLTAMRIRSTQKEIARVMANKDSNMHLRRKQNKFYMYLRLFLIMGVTWSVEIISYLTGWGHVWTKVFYLTDFVNALQGVLIFMLFVLKTSTRKLLLQSLCQLFLKGSSLPKPPLNTRLYSISSASQVRNIENELISNIRPKGVSTITL